MSRTANRPTRWTRNVVAAALAGLTLACAGAATAEVCTDFPRDTCFEDELARVQFSDVLESRWRRAGSTGIADESSLGSFALKGRDAYVRRNREGTVLLRYPVDCARDVGQGLVHIRYKDDGPGARVHVRLLEETDFSDELEPIFEFDSDDRPSLSRAQAIVLRIFPETFEELTGRDTIDRPIRCTSKSYLFEVRLTRSQGGDPRLSTLGLLDRGAD